MNINGNAAAIAKELGEILSDVDEDSLSSLVKEIKGARRVFFSGAGRSLLMLKGFAMRLMQLGYTVYVKGEVVTPAITDKDLLIIGSGSGETGGLTLDAKKVKAIGAKLALITTDPDSTIGKLADLVVKVNVVLDKQPVVKAHVSIQPRGSAFEQSLLLLGDAVVMRLVEQSPASVMTLHANLE